MNIRHIYFAVAVLAAGFAVVGCREAWQSAGNGAAATICRTDALFNVLPQTCVPVMPDDTLRAARGENAVAQFVIDAREDLSGLTAEVKIKGESLWRGDIKGVSLGSGKTEGTSSGIGKAEGASLGIGKSARKMSRSAVCGWVHFVRSSHHYKFGAPDSLLSPTGLFPDPIITDSTETVPAGGRALLTVDIPVTEDIAPGVYTGRAVVRGNGGGVRLEQEFTLKVYPAVLPQEQGLSVTNWFFPDKFPFMNGGKDVEKYGPEYWECYKSLVKTAEAYGQNVWIIYENARPLLKDGKLCFDFTDFDTQAEFLLANVNVRMIEGQHIATRAHNRWADPFWVEVSLPDADGKELVQQRLPYDAPEVREYLTAYFSALDAHLKSKKLPDGRSWSDIYVQHIADEPVNENFRTWETLASIAKEAAPGLKIIEAYRAESYNPELIDIIVPQLDELSWKSYETVPENHQCWIYTCMYPRWNYANRFVTLPLIKTRLLHWLNFHYDSPGYLHWGFNYWGENGDPFGDVSAPVNDWPGGDAYIVYPGFRKVYPSIRLTAMRDGIRDYDLLRLVESLHPGKGRELVGKIILGYDSYDTSVAQFREVRRQLLELASGMRQEEQSEEPQPVDGRAAVCGTPGNCPSPKECYEIEDHGTYSVLRQEGGSELGFSPSSGLKILHQDGFAFKDHNHNGRLDRYEDWRLSPEERAADLASGLPVEKIAGLMLYSMHQAVPTDSVGFWSSTYNGTTLSRSGLPHSALSDKQKKFLDEDNLRAVLVVRVESPAIAAEWNNNLQSFTERLDFGIPVNISSDPRHETKAWAEFNAGAGGQISLWPTSIGLAATFDPEAVRRFGEIASREYRAMGMATALSPQIDLGTEPRWCRYGGTFGEDPELDTDMARAYIDGFQTSEGEREIAGGWGYESVNCMVKHWPGGGPEEAGRDSHYSYGKFAVYPGGNFARHLAPFLNGAFKLDGKTGKAAAVMPFYTISYGIDPSGRNVGNNYSKYIVGDLLRDKYGYDGVACTDWAVTHDYSKVEEADGKCWGAELLSVAERHYEVLKAGVDQFGGNNDKGPVLEAYRMWTEEYGEASARARFEMSARRLLLNMFRTGLFENPYTDPAFAEKTVGCAEYMSEGFDTQKKSVVMLKNRGGILPVVGRKKVYIPETSESVHIDRQTIEKYFDVADNAADADFAVAVIGEPQGGTGYSVADRKAGGNGYVPISLQYGEYTASAAREHSIAGGDPLEASADRSYRGKTVTTANAADAAAVARTKAELGEKPLVTVVYATKPFVPAEIEPHSDALFVAFGVQYQAVFEIISGVSEPSAMLPMQLPANMETVELQDEDRFGDMECYRDSEGNLYDFAFGLGWNGQVKDWRYRKYHR